MNLLRRHIQKRFFVGFVFGLTMGMGVGAFAEEGLSDADAALVQSTLQQQFVGKLPEKPVNQAGLPALLEKLGPAAEILPGPEPANAAMAPFRSDILPGEIGYVRLGALGKPNLEALDVVLNGWPAKGVHAAILDLRGTPPSNDYDTAAEVAQRFAPKGNLLFTIRRANPGEGRMVTSKEDPVFSGVLVVLVDANTSGASEVIAGALGLQARAMVIGQITRGLAAEFATTALPSGKVLRLMTGEVSVAGKTSYFGQGFKPDLQVSVSAETEAAALKAGLERGVRELVAEKERPHMNEAALVAGTNPELEQAYRKEKPELKDAILQRALDFVATTRIYGTR